MVVNYPVFPTFLQKIIKKTPTITSLMHHIDSKKKKFIKDDRLGNRSKTNISGRMDVLKQKNEHIIVKTVHPSSLRSKSEINKKKLHVYILYIHSIKIHKTNCIYGWL